MSISVVDIGSSTFDDTIPGPGISIPGPGISIPIPAIDPMDPTLLGVQVAEFGLAIEPVNDTPGSFNYVHLHGTVGIDVPFLSTSTVRLTVITQRFDIPDQPEVILFSVEESAVVNTFLTGRQLLNFNFSQGGVNRPLVSGYFRYALFLQNIAILPITPPNIVGPIEFFGTSYSRNI